MPWDKSDSMKCSDAKQLLFHAESTYVDLKVLIDRAKMFNSNIHGQFKNKNNLYYRVMKNKSEVYDIITTSFLRREGWKELPHGCSLKHTWNLFWSWCKPDVDTNKLLIWQRINHFPFNKNMTRKDLLYRNLDYFRKQYRVAMPFLPLTFILPK